MIVVISPHRDPKGYSWSYSDMQIVHTVSDGLKQMTFKWLYSPEQSGRVVPVNDLDYAVTVQSRNFEILPEDYILTENDEWQVKSVKGSKSGGFVVTCTLNLRDLEGIVYNTWSCSDQTIEDAVTDLLNDYIPRYDQLFGTVMTPEKLTRAEWSVIGTSVKKRSLSLSNVTPLQIIKKLCAAFMVEPIWNTKDYTIAFKDRVGEDKGVYFRRGLNLKKLEKKSDSYDLYTRILPFGAGGISPGYIDNYQYTKTPRVYVWTDENYTDLAALTEDAAALLGDLSHPIVSYSASTTDLAAQSADYDFLSYSAGDTILIVDADTNTYDKQRIVKTTTYPLAPEKNSVELANCVLTFEELQAKLKTATDAIGNVMTSDGKISFNAVKGLSSAVQRVSDDQGVTLISGNVHITGSLTVDDPSN